MQPTKGSREASFIGIVLYGLLLLFFFQLIAEFVEAIYAFGLMGTSIPIEIVAVLFIFSPLLLLLLPKGLSGWPLVLAGEVMLLCRVAEPLLDTRGRMLVAGLGVACFLILFPALLRNREDREGEVSALILGMGLTMGLLLSVLFRAFGSGSDVSTQGASQAIGWVLAIVAGALLARSRKREGAGARVAGGAAGHNPLPVWKTLGLCLGLAGVLVLGYFAFTSPAVIARWTGVSYVPIVSTVVLVLCLFALLLAARPHLLAALSPGVVLLWNLLFGLALVLTILAHQVRFPGAAGAYPLPEPPATLIQHVPLVLMLLLFPVLLVDWMLFVRELVAGKPSPRALGAGFSLASFYFLFMVFAQVFTTVYDYIPVVGPFFRDKFWLVFLLASIVVTLPVLLVGRGSFRFAGAARRLSFRKAFSGLMILVALPPVAGALLTAARPATPSPAGTSLRILTYNIQQGYSQDGLRSYDGQLDLLREVDADIVGLQESDTARIAGGNADVVRYFADRLDLHSYYGPKTVPGTFGIALLSKYPIENPRTFYMYSEGEQTATIEAQITVGDETFNVFVTHLGNGGPIVQQEAILQKVRGKENVVLMGDFNFRPDTEQYRLTTDVLADSWLMRWPGGTESQGIDPSRRIDHIFLSPGTNVVDSQYLARPESDHPAMMTEVEW
ncbi:MAG TPA: endonuclease/exonuclease/phosphatase family protein [Anaerolineae bacterium]|nr:endonuclease/exonuclease/phosphatase family protein [Anaerolineae bacterium]